MGARLASVTDVPVEQPTRRAKLATPQRRPTRRRLGGAGRWRRLATRVHRWAALVTGVFLLTVVLSGLTLLYEPDLQKLLHPSLYDATQAAQTVSADRARAGALTEVPGFKVDSVVKNRGVWEIRGQLAAGEGPYREIHVDPATADVLGIGNANGGVLGVLKNLHMCALTCEKYAGYWGAMAYELKLFGNELMVGTLLLSLLGLVLFGLALSGLVLWWPGIRRMARSFALRRHKGRYALNYDLHKLVGMAAIPFLLMWSVTGMSFEIKQIDDAWYGVLPGSKPPEREEFTSTPIDGSAVSPAQAERIARQMVPTGRLSSVSLPDSDSKDSAYSISFSEGTDPRQYASRRGDVQVGVDRYSGRAKITRGDPSVSRPVSQILWESWKFPIHSGTAINGTLRTPWLLFGLAPLLLTVTGVTTWLMRRRKRRAKPPLPAV